MPTTKQFRSAKTGKYTTKAKAKKSPATTVSESNTGFAAYKKKENERLAKIRAELGDLEHRIGLLDVDARGLKVIHTNLKSLLS